MSANDDPYPTLTSIHGLNAGLDRLGYMIAQKKGFRYQTTIVTSGSTGTTIPNNGIAILTSISTQTFTLDAPVAGVLKRMVLNSTSTSTAARTIALASGNFQTTAGATYTSFSWIAAGGSIELLGQSTSRYQVLTNNAATLA